MTKAWDDIDPPETKEWLDALNSVLKYEGPERARFILEKLLVSAGQAGAGLNASGAMTTPVCNTIPVANQPAYPGNQALEQRIEAVIRWNAIVMVLKIICFLKMALLKKKR